jgi:hypothetical protein
MFKTNSPITVAVINKSTVVDKATLSKYISALQTQVDRDFAPLYGMSCKLSTTYSVGDWVLLILDDSDQAGALGYHDVTSAGKPIGKVFAKTDREYGLSTSVTMSHELLEILGDAGCNLTAQMSDTTFCAYELCDPVEDDSLGYLINGVLVSDFVTPFYFMASPPSGKLDYCGYLTAPFSIAPGGYLAVWDGTWGEQTNGESKRRAYHQS